MSKQQQMATRCGRCQRKLRMPARYEGRYVNCPDCSTRLKVPSPAQVEAALPDRYVCDPDAGHDDPFDVPKLHPSDPSHGSDPKREETLVIREMTGDVPRGLGDDESLDDVLDGPQVEFNNRLEGANQLVIQETDHLADELESWLTLPASRRSPMRLDIRPLGGDLSPSVLRLLVLALLTAELEEKPAELLVDELQRAMLNQQPIASLIKLGN